MKEIKFENWKQPTEEVVNHFANAFAINFHKDENELKEWFTPEHPFSEDTISNRVRRLNALYHTHLWEEHIKEMVDFLNREGSAFEDLIHAGDPAAVRKLADLENRNCFVFATKYCSFVEPEKYPIYDSLVAGVLMHFHKQSPLIDGKLDFESIRQNCNYESFKTIVDEFKKKYGLEKCSYKDIDKFLWLVGKNA